MVPLVGAFSVDAAQHCTQPPLHATRLLYVLGNVCNAGAMTRDVDPLVQAADKAAELQKQADEAKRELVRLIEHELARGVPKTIVGRRIGVHHETVRRWLKAAGSPYVASRPRQTPARRSP